MSGQERACTIHASLNFIEDEQGSGSTASFLRLLQVGLRRHPNSGFCL
jgi:hypothetical protein